MKRTTFASVAALCALPLIAQPGLAQTASDTETPEPASPATNVDDTDSSTYGVDAEADSDATGATDSGSGTASSGTGSGSMPSDSGSGTASSETGSGSMSSESGSGSSGSSSETTGAGGSESGAASDGAPTGGDQAQTGEAAADPLIVTVAGEEITASDVRDAIAMLPPQIRQNPPEVVVPFAVEQLVMRALVLQKAEQENLAEDEEVTALADSEDPAAIENAVVQVFVRRNMEGVVTDEAVQAAYDELSANSDTPLPPIEDLRPQIEQQLQQEKLVSVRDALKQEFEVVYYGPDGQPREASTEDTGSSGGSTSAGSASGGNSSGTSGGGSGSGSEGGSETSGSGSSGDSGSGSSDGSSSSSSSSGSGSGSSGDTGSGSNDSSSGTSGDSGSGSGSGSGMSGGNSGTDGSGTQSGN